MVNLMKIVTALLPVLAQKPPAVEVQPVYVAATNTIDHQLTVAAELCERERKRLRQKDRKSRSDIRPDQAGERISFQWLQTLRQGECVWRFRYVCSICLVLSGLLIVTCCRVSADELIEMAEVLGLPEIIITPGRHSFDPIEALGLTLARFRTAGDQYELSLLYNRSQAAISEIVNWVVTFVDNSWSHLLDFDHEYLLSPPNLEKYAAAIHRAGAPLTGVWGFIDCTIRRICRPSKWQRAAYNGHKKFHALKFQAIMLPNGLFGHLFGPEEARRNDNHLLRKSGILEACEAHAVRDGTTEDTPADQRYLQIFGDPAYGVSHQIISPFSAANARSEDEQQWNAEMASVRIEVEHGFGIVANKWPFLNAGWKMQVYRSPVGRYYRAGVLFTNAITCLGRENQVSAYFDCQPPDLRDYFHD